VVLADLSKQTAQTARTPYSLQSHRLVVVVVVVVLLGQPTVPQAGLVVAQDALAVLLELVHLGKGLMVDLE
jgi:hypothetical protein